MLIEYIINSLVVLLIVLDPLGVTAIFATLTHGTSVSDRQKIAFKGTVISAIILILFGFLGHYLLNALNITLDAFSIAGGLFLLLLSIDMVFARQSGLRGTTQEEAEEAESKADISVFPLAIPLIAGPGGITTMLLLMGEAEQRPLWVFALFCILLIVLIGTYFTLLIGGRLITYMGETGANAISRVLGILLAALAIQYIIDGVRGAFALGGSN